MKDIGAAFVARVGSELELKTSAAGKPWTSVNVAVGDGGEVQENGKTSCGLSAIEKHHARPTQQ